MEQLLRLYDDPTLRGVGMTAGLMLARLLPLVVFTPILGGEMLPRRFRVAVATMIVIVMLPGLPMPPDPRPGPIIYLGLAVKEAVVGLTVSTLVVMMFRTLTAFGSAVDLFRGATIANVRDPITRQQQSLLATFFTQLAVVLFLSLGGLQVIFEGLADSVTAIPLFEAAPEALTGGATTAAIIRLSADLIRVALQLSAPVLAVILLTDVVLGVLNKMAPQVQVYFVGLTIKGALGLLVMVLALASTYQLIFTYYRDVLDQILDWVRRGFA